MEMKRLEAFCKVVEFKSFTKAAEALLLSQPTISEHIRLLESTVGEKLIDRLGREVLPTPAGQIFYQYARNIVQMRNEAFQALEQFKGNLAGRLILGASTIPGTYVLPKLIGSFKSSHPAIHISLRISDTTEIAQEVLESYIEAGVVGSKWVDRKLILEELGSDELVLVVYPEHPWAKKGTIDVKSLAGEPFVLREVGSGTRMVMNRILEDHGFDLSLISPVAEMGSTEAVRQAIKARIGISILSKRAVEEDIARGSLASVTIEGVRLLRPLYLIQRKNRRISPVCKAFLDHLRSELKALS